MATDTIGGTNTPPIQVKKSDLTLWYREGKTLATVQSLLISKYGLGIPTDKISEMYNDIGLDPRKRPRASEIKGYYFDNELVPDIVPAAAIDF